MSWHRTALFTTLAPTLLLAGLAEKTIAQAPIRTAPPTVPGTVAKHPKQEPCWEVAGISKSVIEERRSIERQAHQEVEAVCADSALSPQQKRQEIRQIHQREKEQIDAIISPEQREALRSCQQERSAGHVGGGHPGVPRGPCGEILSGSKPNPQREGEEAPPQETPKPN